MGMGMKSLKWEGIGTKNLFPHTSSSPPSPTSKQSARRSIDQAVYHHNAGPLHDSVLQNLVGIDAVALIICRFHYFVLYA